MSSDVTTGAQSAPPRKRARGWRWFLEAYALVLLVAALVVFFSVWEPTRETFPTIANFQILVGNQAVIGIVAIGALIPLVANEWDLSVGAVAGLSAIVSAMAMTNGFGVLVSPFAGIAVGLAVGAFNALLVTRFGVNGVITTLGVSTMLAGVTSQITGGLALTANIPDAVVEFGLGTWLGLPKIALALVVVVVAAWYLLELTPFGRYLYAVGASPDAARLVGIRLGVVIGSAFIASAVLASIGGVLSVARQAGADPRTGVALTLPALAAAFLSAASIKPGQYNVGGTVVAIFFLAVLNNGLIQAGLPNYVTSYVNGAALIVGVGLSAYLGRLRRAEKRAAT